MNGNQGLEALAALCGGEAAVAADNNNNNNGHHNQQQEGVGSSPCHANAHSHSTQSLHGQTSGQQGGGQHQTAEVLSRQQWQQAIAAAAALGAAGANNSSSIGGLTAQGLALLQAAGLQPPATVAPPQPPKPNIDSNAALAAMQQLAYFRYIQEQTNAAVANLGQNSSSASNGNGNALLHHSNHQAVALALAGQAQQLQQHLGGSDAAGRQQVLPPAATPSSNGGAAALKPDSLAAANSMPPPPSGQGSSSLPSTFSTAGIGGLGSSSSTSCVTSPRHTAIAPLPNVASEGTTVPIALTDGMASAGVVMGDKKLQKRAANRRSAQLSRKRKKQFIEELKDENDELRRKEQILRSIPDLIVVFDSTGKLWFVSQSVSRFMNMTAKELEGTSFWDRLCEDSVRLLKAAFMDSLAARTDESETAPLGSGIWELRLVDKDGGHKVVTLNGVVHFSGDRPECVCSIRPRDDPSMIQPTKRKQRKNADGSKTSSGDVQKAPGAASVSTGNGSDGTTTTEDSTNDSGGSFAPHFQPLIRAKPQQSVISCNSSSRGSSAARINNKVKAAGGTNKRREAARISDGDSGSTDSGSSDEIEETAD